MAPKSEYVQNDSALSLKQFSIVPYKVSKTQNQTTVLRGELLAKHADAAIISRSERNAKARSLV